MIKKLIIWYRAMFLDYPYWRIYYPDGERSTLLYYDEAYGVAEVYNGKLRIDYGVET